MLCLFFSLWNLFEKTVMRCHENLHVSLGWSEFTVLKGQTNCVVKHFEDFFPTWDWYGGLATSDCCYFVLECIIRQYRHHLVRHRASFSLTLMVEIWMPRTFILLMLFKIDIIDLGSFFQKIWLTLRKRGSYLRIYSCFNQSILILNHLLVVLDTHNLGFAFLLGSNHLVALFNILNFKIRPHKPFLLFANCKKLLFLILIKFFFFWSDRVNQKIPTSDLSFRSVWRKIFGNIYIVVFNWWAEQVFCWSLLWAWFR